MSQEEMLAEQQRLFQEARRQMHEKQQRQPPPSSSADNIIDLSQEEPPRTSAELEGLHAQARAWRGAFSLCESADKREQEFQWRCSRGHTWKSRADRVDEVRLQRFWCPHWLCLRGAHPLRRSQDASFATTTAQEAPSMATLLQMARSCGCEPGVPMSLVNAPADGIAGGTSVQAVSHDGAPEPNATMPSRSSGAAGEGHTEKANPCTHTRIAWRCRVGCTFEQSMLEGYSTPGWCPECLRHRDELLRSLSGIATAAGGCCVKVLSPQV